MKWVASALFALVVSAVPLSAPAAAPMASIKVGARAPDFQLRLMDGTKVTLDELRGNVVVLNFWATWCVPCRKELPTLDLYYALRKDAGLRVFAVATEDSLQPYQLKKLFAVMHIPAVRSVRGPYAPMGGVPTNIVIDRNGVVRYAKAAVFDLDALNEVLVPLLREKANPAP